MIKNVTVVHNQRCRKSRELIQWLIDNKIDYSVINYMQDGIQEDFLKSILKKLQMNADNLMRINEPDYKLHVKGKNLKESDKISLMIEFPKLIERPIVIVENDACVARPIENFVQWFRNLKE